MRPIIESGLGGRTISDVFDYINPVPLASASIAQVLTTYSGSMHFLVRLVRQVICVSVGRVGLRWPAAEWGRGGHQGAEAR